MLDVPLGHPDFGRAVPCQCRANERAQRRQAALTRVSNLNQLEHMTFDTFYPNRHDLSEGQQSILRRTIEIVYRFASRPQGWLLLSGSYGTGKTHLAAAIAHDVIGRGEPALFVVVPDLLDHLRAAFAPNSETTFDQRFETVRQASLLILDDFGSQSATPWANEKLFQILNHRYTARLATVITTNLRLPEIESRLRSRLSDPDLVTRLLIDVPDYRASNSALAQDSNTLAMHADQTFENFDLRDQELPGEKAQNLQKAKALAEAFAIDPQGWLVLTGEYGCGKTHLAAAIANRYLRVHRKQPMFLVVPDLLDYLRSAFNPNSTSPLDVRFEELRRAPLLILDDLGTESATPWAREKLFQLLDYRYVARLPTVFTSVAPVVPGSEDKGDKRRPSAIIETHPWLASRMLDSSRSTIIAIAAPGYRIGKGQKDARRKRQDRLL